MKKFRVVSVNTSSEKGIQKTPVKEIHLQMNFGVSGDAHGGPGVRQVSLLAIEDITDSIARGFQVKPGDFAENITTEGIDLASLPIGSQLTFGDARLEISQIGKKCHTGCAIFKRTGDCIMPKRGVFAKVIKEGVVSNESIGMYGF